MKILMVEDNKSVSEMMGMFFQKKHGMPTLRMMVMKRLNNLVLILIVGILLR